MPKKLTAMSDDDLCSQISEWYRDAKDKSKDWRVEAKVHYDAYAGRQWKQDEQAAMEEELRQAVTFNRIGPLVDAVVGYQINNRQEVRYLPRQIGDTQVSEVLSGAGAWIEDEANTEDEEEEIFFDLLVTGMGWSEARMSYDEDMDGQLIPGERFSLLEAYWDNNAKRRNLADSKWRGRGRWMRRDDAEYRWPDLGKYSFSNDEFMWEEEDEQDEPHNAARAHFYENDSRQWYNRHKDEIFVFQCQWYELTPIVRVGDPSGRILELSENKFSKLKDHIEAQGIPFVRQQKKTFHQAFIAGPVVLERGDCTWKEGFTLMSVTGKRDAQKNQWFGLVRGLVQPQMWSNKFLSDLQDMIVSNRQGGAYVEQSALINPRDAEVDWNASNPLILLQDGALQRGAVQDRTPPPLPPAVDRMIEWSLQAIPSVSGINQEFMGYANRDQPNVLEVQRKRSAINVLAPLFSSIRKYRKDRARAMLAMMREYLNDGRLIRVVGGDGSEKFIPLAMDPDTEDYDIVIDESSSSPNQKEETFTVLMSMAPFLQQAGIMPPMEALDYMPLPSSLVSAWKEQLNPKEPNPEAQKQAQILEFAATSEAQKDQADAQYKGAQAKKAAAEAETQELINMAVKNGIISVDEVT